MLDLQFTIEEISDHRVEGYFNDLGITNYLISIFFPITIRRYHDYTLNQHASAQLQSAFKVLKSQIVTQALTSTDKNMSFGLDAIQLSVCPIHFPKGGIFLLVTPSECSANMSAQLTTASFINISRDYSHTLTINDLWCVLAIGSVNVCNGLSREKRLVKSQIS